MIELNALKLLDLQDPLNQFRNHFFHQENEIYLDGNSLGKLPKKVAPLIEHTIKNEWGKQLIRSWNENWLALPERLSHKYSKLLNSSPGEIIFGESTTVRLYQVLHALIQSRKYPNHLITDHLNFPTDQYVLQGLTKQFENLIFTSVEYGQEIQADISYLKEKIQKNPGILCLSLVSYKSAFFYPMRELNEFAAQKGSIIVWDLSHAVGAVPINFKESKTKVALGCTYKYMNGGPGSPAFLYIESALQQSLENPIQGWFGHQNPFDFTPDYHPALGINRFNNGTPSVLSLQAVEIGIDLTLKAGINNIRSKSIKQAELLIEAIKNDLTPLGYTLQSPEKNSQRGSHIAIAHPHAWQICQALICGAGKSPKIIPDFRPPDILRIGITPLYTRFEDLWWVVHQLLTIVESKSFLNFDEKRSKVT